ncbi:type II secretion system F family protein [Alteromonas sp. ASW11-19]|uniref:Type II secretion system F family protein n=1 Tax=Alteromonas salexigens TaxID=2982530 RepID=A0ABT2VN02_9ALTE|nr:type II secretion system F family protein [Alteromonas salexigens]MCU7554692.1 type II secretion system F family protein [Alteromonas salexigens]
MAKFEYTGRELSGSLSNGVIEAADEQSAVRLLRARNVIPLSIKSQDDDSSKGQDISDWFLPGVRLDELVIFCRQMYSLTKAGIPILRAVGGLAESSTSKRLRAALEDVIAHLERGRNFSSALNQHSEIFGHMFVSVVHVGENTGRLDEAFAQLAEYLEREQETRKQIKAATRYPIFVVVAISIAFVIMNIFVIPKFSTMFAKFDAELPLVTRALIGMSDFMINFWWLILIVLGLGLFALHRYINSTAGRYKWDKNKLKLPVVGSIFRRSLLGRYCRSFAMMLRGGVPLTTALNLTADAVDNAYMADKITTMRKSIEKGESLARVSASSGLFTPMVMQMIRVGEETGQVDELLKEASEFYEREVDFELKSLTAKIEPILIVIVAGMVLVLALGIFTPMWDMMGAIKGN